MINIVFTVGWSLAAAFFAVISIAASLTGVDPTESIQFGLISILFFNMSVDRLENRG